MEPANERNNEHHPVFLKGDTLGALVATCREKMWPLLKNSTRISYDFYLNTHILPKWGPMRISKMRTIGLQDFFNSYYQRENPRLCRGGSSSLTFPGLCLSPFLTAWTEPLA
ncbi:MAG: tyrosine-type recombinase/integrase [Acidobacteriaceae bacterium]